MLTIDFCSSSTPMNPIAQIAYYPKLKERLAKNPKGVVQDLEHLRSTLLDPRSMRFSVVGDIANLDGPSSTWLDCFEPVKPFPVRRSSLTIYFDTY
jgi:Zn-dependent M16 (insulinase) family peptidase